MFKNKGIENFKKVLKSGKEKIVISREKLRDYMKKFKFTETVKDDKVYKDFIYDSETNDSWMDEDQLKDWLNKNRSTMDTI